MPDHKTVTFDVELRRIAHELRTYNPQADEYHGEHIHKVWAKEIDALLAAPTPAAQSAGQEACWAVYNGWSLQAFFQSKEKASEYASEMQKNHDLSGSLAAFVVKPLYAAPVNGGERDTLTVDQWLDLAQRHANADWNSDRPDGFLTAVKALCTDFANIHSAPVRDIERELGQVIDERDQYHDAADKLANAVAEYFGVEIGEHSNLNCLWQNALDHIAHATKRAADAQQVGICSDCGSASPVDCSGRGCFAHEEERAADAPKMRAGYGETDFGYTFVGVTLEEGDKRLMALLVSALGTEHAAIDDMTNLIFRSRALSSPAKVGRDERESSWRFEDREGGDVVIHPPGGSPWVAYEGSNSLQIVQIARAALSADGGDTELLDWLAQHGAYVAHSHDGEVCWVMIEDPDEDSGRQFVCGTKWAYDNPRDAIRAAIAAKAKGEAP